MRVIPYLLLITVLVAGCGETVETSDPSPRSETPVSFRASGSEAFIPTLTGGLVLAVTANNSTSVDERYHFSAETEDHAFSLQGNFQIPQELAPVLDENGEFGTDYRPTTAGAENFDAWLTSNPGLFTVIRHSACADDSTRGEPCIEKTEFIIDAFELHFDRNGKFVDGRIEGAARDLLDLETKMIEPRTRMALSLAGTLTPGCLRVGADSSVELDREFEAPRCRELFRGLVATEP